MQRIVPIIAAALSAMLIVPRTSADPTPWNFKQEMLPALIESVPNLLKLQNQQSGRFGSGIWIPDDQTPIYALSAAWTTRDPQNPYYHDAKLLQAIIKGGDVLVKTQDKDGQWEFRKKDNSVWGRHYNPWVYSRWVRTFSLVRHAMPTDRRARWEKALTLGYSGIAKHALARVHNIPAHDAMGLYIAGQALNRPEWCAQAAEFMRRVAAAQDLNGFWSEHYGPVVAYNFVYADALGIYYALSQDDKVLPALERAAHFHANFIYPEGTCIETIDERNPYSAAGHLAGPGFSFSPEGRAYLFAQWERTKEERTSKTADAIASMLLYAREGIVDPSPVWQRDSVFLMADGRASVIRKRPWCASLSAYTCPIEKNRWIQDRQNFISLFHETTGLILGGGNTKLQPLWSTFTVGDTKLLSHKPGDKNPNFSEPPGLLHVPSEATLDPSGDFLKLRYGTMHCTVRLALLETNKARLTYTVLPSDNTLPVAAHVTFLPGIDKQWRTASGKTAKPNDDFNLTAAEAGPWFEHNGWRVQLPKNSYLMWPALRHNPYREDGRSDLGDGRIVLTLPFSKSITTYEVDVEIVE